MIGRQYPAGSVDEVAVRRDDELLELLGRRSAPREADAVGSLLWALTLDVDREDDALAPEPRQGDLVGARRRHGARGTVIGVVVAATLSVSGVAAAVTGDPLSPYRAVISLAQDDGPPAVRRPAAPAPDPVRREAATTGPARATVVVPEVLGRAPSWSKPPRRPPRNHHAPTRPHGTTRGPDAGDGPAARKDAARGAAEDAAKDQRRADRKAGRKATPVPRATPEQDPAPAEKAARPQPRRPETKEQRGKP